MSSFRGKFVWYELMTTDTSAAGAFYRRVVGWGTKDAGLPNMQYTLLTVGETSIGGMMVLPEQASKAGARPGWIGYVAVDDVDATAARFSQEGGVIHHAPDDIPGVGRFAVVGDPQGAALALFTGRGEAPGAAPPRGTPGHAGWRELVATDAEAAFAFYAKLFGWGKGNAIDMGEMGSYQQLTMDGETFGGIVTKPKTVPTPVWRYYFNVDDIDAGAARVRDGGGQVLNGRMQVPGGNWVVHCRDPQGGMFALYGPQR
jgi:hypothetical protein